MSKYNLDLDNGIKYLQVGLYGIINDFLKSNLGALKIPINTPLFCGILHTMPDITYDADLNRFKYADCWMQVFFLKSTVCIAKID